LHPARHASDDEEKRLELRKTQSRKVVDDLYEWRLEQRPLSASPPAPSEDASTAAVMAIADRLSVPDQLRFGTNLEKDMSSLSGSEACWTTRTLYTGIQNVGSPHQGVLARAVVLP
jgi:hypothetical protein